MGRSVVAAALEAEVAAAVDCGAAAGSVGFGAGALVVGVAGVGTWQATSSATPLADTSSRSALRRLSLDGVCGTRNYPSPA
ncbi:MAG TPA: hypothetical protein VKQ30_15765 [Ktedonobacterales bacterium]|nr:hypothetical protein [Ktedonobacterales bacterium]